jgi:hypothetical protein
MGTGIGAERAARNEAAFRRANERIEQRLDDLSLRDGRSPFLCECDNPLCTDPVRLTVAQYESVRAHPTRFVVAPGHGGPGTETVARGEHYEVIEKHGAAGAEAARLDPRNREVMGPLARSTRSAG